jgi:hypothetical protein
MRFVDSSSLVKFSCVVLTLLPSSGKIHAEPFGSESGSWPSNFSLFFADTGIPVDVGALEYFDTLHMSEVFVARNTGSDSGADVTELLLSSHDMGVIPAEGAQLELSPSVNGMLLAQVEAVPAPESSTLFLLGLGLLGLAQIPIRKLARKSQDRRRQPEDVRADLRVSETPLAAQNAHAAHEHHLNA